VAKGFGAGLRDSLEGAESLIRGTGNTIIDLLSGPERAGQRIEMLDKGVGDIGRAIGGFVDSPLESLSSIGTGGDPDIRMSERVGRGMALGAEVVGLGGLGAGAKHLAGRGARREAAQEALEAAARRRGEVADIVEQGRAPFQSRGQAVELPSRQTPPRSATLGAVDEFTLEQNAQREAAAAAARRAEADAIVREGRELIGVRTAVPAGGSSLARTADRPPILAREGFPGATGGPQGPFNLQEGVQAPGTPQRASVAARETVGLSDPVKTLSKTEAENFGLARDVVLDEQRLVGAEEAARRFGLTAEQVRSITGQSGRTPLKKELAMLDRGFQRALENDAGFAHRQFTNILAGGAAGAAQTLNDAPSGKYNPNDAREVRTW